MYYYLSIEGKECEITIEELSATNYDRGNFIAKLFPRSPLNLSIDSADGWPRYYFDLERARLELEAWLKVRDQWLGEFWVEKRLFPERY
jgi:hypothetical protein